MFQKIGVLKEGILFSKKCNHFMAECNVFANENIYDGYVFL